MALKLSKTPTSDFIEYGRFRKKSSAMFLIIVVSIIIAAVLVYLGFLRHLKLFEGTWIVTFLSHVKTHLFAYTFLGLFYACLFGGLFFMLIPIEAFYVAALKKGLLTPYHILFMFLGLITSYSINYIIGLRFSKLSKNIVSPKKFYRVKILINKFGKLAILFFNIIGMGSQQLTAVLGVFRYNKTRLLIFSLTGQLIKYTIITAAALGLF